ncbi:MAG: ATP-binding protein [Leptolyngbyaceae cyanobacterium SM2_5_2]|nr:ATP-binding protein [Leptolyngbyaceae cyanobacterium SM2_5_2]
MSQALSNTLTHVRHYRQAIDALLLYGGVFDTAVGQTFLTLLEALENQLAGPSLRAYSHWFQALATAEQTWVSYLQRQIAYADNAFTQQVQRSGLERLPQALVQAARQDLVQLQWLHNLEPAQVSQWVQVVGNLTTPPIAWAIDPPKPPFQFEPHGSWAEALPTLAQHYQQHGVGKLAQYRAFTWQQGELWGIPDPDPIQLSQLTAYDHPRQQLIQNTQALLQGYPALNVLLYGSRGAGKSSLVKALVNEYAPQGLRLVEVAKTELHHLPQIVERLRSAPQTFIIFVDDLSFEEDDDAFKALKVVLEGSVTARPPNMAVYATSNRRHLVREYFSDRPRPSDQDEIQAWDTLQEKLSFSDRFGLTLTFEPADQPTYLVIVQHLAQQAGLTLPQEELTAKALQWATRHNGRSGRTARQFIDWLRAEAALAQ